MLTKWSTTTRIIVIFLLIALFVVAAYEFRPLIGPVIIAGLMAYILNLGVRFITPRVKLGRKWVVFTVFLIFVAIIVAMPSTLVPVAIRQIRTLSLELEDVNIQIQSVVATPILIGGIEIPLDEAWNDLTNITTDFGSAFEGALAVIETTSVSLIYLIIIFVTTYYLLMDWEGLRDWLLNILPESSRDDACRLLREIDSIWRAYMQGTLALMLIMGVLFTIIGYAIGLPGALAVGLLTGILSMIPELGPWISGIIAVLIAYFGGSNHLPISNFWFAVLVAGIYLVVTQIKSIWLRPQVMGRFMHMNTGVVFFAILAAAMLQGILAALIVLPVLATLGLIGRYIRARLLNLDPWPPAVDVETPSNIAETAQEEDSTSLQSM